MIPFEPFDFYIKRKLYVHNMGHAVCAYLGVYTCKDYIYESIDDVNIQSIVQNAMMESALALSRKYQVPMEDLVKHIQDLLARFTNQALKDTCKRVGGDPKRKLSAADRLIGSASLCLECGLSPVFICVGIAGAVYQYIREQALEQGIEQAKEVLRTVSGLEENHPLYEYVLPLYQLYIVGVSVREIKQHAEKLRAKELKEVI